MIERMSGDPEHAESAVREAYDTVAEPYAAAMADELDHKPLDRALLDAFGEMCCSGGGSGRVLDAGCGPGYAMRYLRDRGVAVCGVDLSPAMVVLARSLLPAAEVAVGSLLDLPHPDEAFAGVLSLYSVIHLPPDALPVALGELRRVLAPGGHLLLSFHARGASGEASVHLGEWFGRPVDLVGWFPEPQAVADALAAVGLELVARLDRRGDPAIEIPTERTYLLARRPAGRG